MGGFIHDKYIDRSQSDTSDNRFNFPRMINDSTINKARSRKNGIGAMSAKEILADDASSILLEGFLKAWQSTIELSCAGFDYNYTALLQRNSSAFRENVTEYKLTI